VGAFQGWSLGAPSERKVGDVVRMGKLPSLQFYPGDWMKDPAVRSVTVAARGLWIDMLCLMHESDRRGYLQHATGRPVSSEQLARMTGCSASEVARLLRELEECGVFSRTDAGVIYNRRMVLDERKRVLCSDAGRRGGGSPAFKGRGKGEVKGPTKASSSSSVSYSNSLSPREWEVGSGEVAPDLPEGLGRHPALIAYWEKFRLVPSVGAQQQIEEEVTDLERWRAVLDYWEAGSWRPESIPRMLERYRETDPASAQGEDRYVDRSESASARNARERLESAILLTRR
jgi:DNA-binding Lrp family transcriptional regulator